MDSHKITPNDLSRSLIADLKVYEPPESPHTEELAEISEGDIVTWNGDDLGVVVSVMKENFDWPGTDGEIEASSDEPVYIVARETGGSKPFHGSDIEQADGPIDDEVDLDNADEADLAMIYYRMDNPEDINQFRSEYEELQNIPGVDDPHVGFNNLPNGWTRKSVLQAWASLGGTWRSCFARMSTKKGPRFARRWCSALKDEVLQTEEWRGKF